MTNITHKGGCHCGAVQFEVAAPAAITVDDCNCSICSKSGYLHLIVSAADFNLLQGEAALTEYQFNTGTARHLFCKTCGVKSFYVPRSHPNGYSVNARCLENASIASITIRKFEGKNWEQGMNNYNSPEHNTTENKQP